MAGKDGELLKRLLATFKIEADEHLKAMSSGLLDLETAGASQGQANLIETVFREAHSLKGAARAVNLTEIESLCQALESVFGALKREDLKPSAGIFDLLQEALDVLGQILPSVGAERLPEERILLRQLSKRLEGASKGEPETMGRSGIGELETRRKDAPPPTLSSSPVTAETVRVSTAKLSSVLLQSEEMLSAKLAAGQRALDLRTAHAAFDAWAKEWAKILPLVQNMRSAGQADIKEGKGRQSLAKVLNFLEWNSTFVKSLERRSLAEAKSAERDSRALGAMVGSLLDDMKKVLMFPFSSLLEVLPKVVRDLSRDSGKDVELTIHGGEVEIDRRILEEMKDPLVHLVRNAIDHGIEKPEERKQKNKPWRGAIRVAVSPVDNKVEVIVADDGAGISLAGVRSAALKLGLVARDKAEELTGQELLSYVFQSGVSTSPIITELSGRGLGLAIVAEKVGKLGGSVSLETDPDAGTRFRILLPQTVATFRGILLRVGERAFLLPTTHVERALRLKPEEVKTVENRETIELDGRPVSLARLAAVLGLPASKNAPGTSDLLQAVILTATGTSIAFLVDEVVGEQDVLLKSLGPQLSRVRNVAGAAVLGSGRVVPVLNVPDLLKSAVKVSAPPLRPDDEGETQGAEATQRCVLVVEDSITTRTLLQNILEVTGYRVVTAVDGVDALAKLKSAEFDIVVSDVDMPRMNGFELTAKIRGDKSLGDLPVVLVTALASPEDRERGIDVGANAYIVKSSFDQSNLLEVIRRFV